MRISWWRVLAGALVSSIAIGAAPARADESDAAKRTQAANFFDAGAEAYKAGKYVVAAEAFQKAHETLPSPSLLFSAAQAYRRQYLSEPSIDVLRRAIALYREYLRADPKANRREDAMEALQVLVPLDVQAGAAGAVVAGGSAGGGATGGGAAGGGGAAAAAAAGGGGAVGGGGAAAAAAASDAQAGRTARILVSASVVGAEVSLDGAAFVAAPLVTAVTPGDHQARVRAAGYDDEDVTVRALPNDLVARHVGLQPKPAKLGVTGTSGARVSVDGRVRALVPSTAPIALDPGSHFVAVTLGGHEPLIRRFEAGRDQAIELRADLPLTRQRLIAWSGLALGAAGLVTTGALTGITFARQSEALALDERPASQPLSVAERDTFNRAVRERNDFAQGAGIAAAASAVVLATSVGLFVLDEPEVAVPDAAQPAGPAKSAPRTTFDLGLGSLSVRVSF